MLYSPTTVPKAPDKCACCIDDEQNTEAQFAPWSGEKDHAGMTQPQYLYGSLTRMCQRSPCDINHMSHEATCLNIASSILGTTGRDMDIPLARHVDSMPVYYSDDDWSSSEPEMEAREDDMTSNMSNKITALSNCSDELREASSGMHEPSICSNSSLEEWDDMYCEPNEGSESVSVRDELTNNMDESNPVQLACIREYHHYLVSRFR